MRNNKSNIFSFFLYAGHGINSLGERDYYTIYAVQIYTILRFHPGNWITEDSLLLS